MQNYMASVAIQSLTELKEVDSLIRLNNDFLSTQIENSIVGGSSSLYNVEVLRIDVRFLQQFIKVEADIRFDDDSGNSVLGKGLGDILLVFSGNSLIWLPHFSEISIVDTNFRFGGELFEVASNALLDTFMDNINGELIRGIMLNGDNTLAINAIPVDRIEVESVLATLNGATAPANQDLGGVFTVAGSSILIEPTSTTVALDFEFLANIASCP
ncbi:MAG: hypothetical protein R3192_16910, partial [Woeseiaceae bacterium]|nr:hypothetical protein [Woeseiaceae bacterium]